MSTTIDEKIVSMQFDNRHFESNVNTTMSTLDKLKQKLRFSDSAKGFEDINSAAKKCDLSPLAKSAETVSAKFSAMQVMGVTALANLTNSAVNAGKKIVSALTIDPVKTGLSEYETKMNAIQVLQANTRGKNDMNDINKALEELNVYADKTIYNFAQMTSNAGKFAAQGMDVYQATNAIKGLANLAAASGASAEDMSRATYQMSQSMGGYIKLIDWNSLRNANMATQDLKNTLIDLAKVNGVAIDDMIKKHGTFEQTLSEGWLSGEMFTKAMNIYSGIYSDAELAAMGFNEAQIKNFKELAAMAESAATEVKTFTQLFDVLKETAQSGWTQTWEIIIGDFETAKKNLTKLQVYFSGLIDKMSNARNVLFGGAFNPKKTWGDISTKISSALGLNKLEKVVNTVDKLNRSLEEYRSVIRKVWDGEFGNADTIFGDASSGRYKLLEDAGYNHKIVQSLVDKGYYYVPTDEEIEAAFERYGVTTSKAINKSLKATKASPDDERMHTLDETAEATNNVASAIDALSDEQLKNAGLTQAEINLYRDLAEEAKRSGKTIDELVDEMSKLDGRERMINALKNAWSGISGIFSAGSTAWGEIFEPFTAVDLYKIITSIEKFSEALRIEKESETFKDLVRIFKGVFAILDIITTLAGGAFKIVFKVVSQLLGAFNMTVLDFLALIGDAAVNVRDFIDGILDFSIIIEHVTEGVKQLIESWGTWIQNCMDAYAKDGVVGLARAIADGFVNAFKNVGKWFGELFSNIGEGASNLPGLISDSILGKIWDVLKIVGGTMVELGKIIIRSICAGLGMEDSVAENIINGIGDIVSSIKTWFAELPGNVIAGLEQIPGFINSGFMQGMWDGVKNVGAVVIEFAKTIIDNICSVLGIHSPSTVMIAIGGFIIAGLIGGLTSGSSSVFDWIKDFGSNIIGAFQNIDFGKIVAIFTSVAIALTATKLGKVLGGISDLLGGVGDLLGGVGEVLAKSAGAIRKVIKNVAKVVKSFSKVLDGFAKIEKATAFSIRMNAISTLIKSILLLVAAIVVLTLVDTKKLLIAAGVVVTLIAALTIMLKTLSGKNLDPKQSAVTLKNMLGFSSMLTSLALAMIAVAIAAKIIGGMDDAALIKAGIAIVVLAGIVVGLMAATKLLAKNDKGNVIGGVNKIGKMMMSFAGAMLVVAIAARIIGGMEWEDLAKAGAALLVVAGVLVGLMAATKLVTKTNKGNITGLTQLGKILTSLATSLLIIAIAARLFGGMEWEDLGKAGAALVVISGVMVGLMAATKLLTKNKLGNVVTGVDNVGRMLLSIAKAMLITAIAAKIFGSMEWEDLGKAGAAIIVLAGVMVGLMAATKLLGTGAQIDKLGGTLAKIGLAMLIMSFAAKSMASLSPDELKAASKALIVLGGVVTGLIAATRLASGKELKGVASSLLGMSLAIGILAAIAVLLSLVDENSLKKGIGAVSALAAMMSIMTASTGLSKIDKNTTSTIYAMAVAIGIMAAAVVVLSLVDENKLKTAAGALTVLMLSFSAMIASTGSMPKGKVSKTIGVLAALVGVVAVLAVIIGIMSKFTYNSSVIKNATAIGILGVALVGMMKIFSMVKIDNRKKMGKTVGVLYALVGVVAALALIVGVMSAFSYNSSVIKNTFALSGLLLALAGVAAVLNLIPATSTTGMGKKIGVLFALAGVVAVLAIVLGAMSAFSTGATIGHAASLVLLIGALAGVLAVLNLIKVGPGVALGIVALTALVIPLYAIAQVLKDLSGVDISLNTIEGLVTVIGTFGVLLGVLTLVGMAGPAAMIGVGSLIGTIASLAVFIGAIGALVDQFPVLETFLDVGITILEKLASGIGSIVGHLIDGFLNAATQRLPEIGTKLGDFMDNAMPFIEGAKKVTGATLEGVGILTASILALTVANFIDGVLSLITFGSSFADLGTTLSQFGTNVTPFLELMSTFDPKVLEGTKTLAEALLILTASNLIDQLTSFITGGTDLAAFGTSAAQFGEGLKNFSESIKDMDDDTLTRTKIAAEAAKCLAEMADALPKDGGIWQSIVGTSDMADFGNKLASFGESLVAFSASVSDLSDADIAKIKTAAEAGKELAGIEDAIPKKGGVWQDIAGESDIATFGLRLVAFGASLVAYAETIQSISDADISKINTATEAGKALAELEGILPKQDGWWQDIAGSSDIGVFGSKLSTFGEGIMDYVDAVKNLTDSDVSAIESSKNALKAIIEVAKEVPTSGSIWEFFVGSNDAGTFGTGIKALSDAISSYINTSIGINDADIDSIKNSKDAITALKDIAKEAEGIGFSVGLENTANGIDKIRQALEKMSSIDTSSIAALMNSSSGVIPAIKNTAVELSGVDTVQLDTASQTISRVAFALNGLCNVKFDDLSGITFVKPNFEASDIQEFINIFTSIETDMWSLMGETGKLAALSKMIEVVKSIDFTGLSEMTFDVPTGITSKKISDFISIFTDIETDMWSLIGETGKVSALKKFINTVTSINFSAIEDISIKQPKNLSASAINKFLSIFTDIDSNTFDLAESNIKSLKNIIGEAEGITSESIANLNSLPEISAASINAFVQAFSDAAPTISTTGSEFINGLIEGMNSVSGSAIEAAKTLVANACSGIYVYYNSFYMAGIYCWKGLKNGLLNGTYEIYKAGNKLGINALGGFQSAVLYSSPSKKFYEAATFCIAGIVNGFADGESAVYASGKTSGENAIDGFSDAISKVTDVINSDLDVQPTIRPILDLSNVQSGAGKINSMLNMDASVGAYATAGAINATMSNRQNRSTGDVISAIKDLGKNLGKSSGDTYQVNGVTYDDGSNVSDAVGALVRAIKVERRK